MTEPNADEIHRALRAHARAHGEIPEGAIQAVASHQDWSGRLWNVVRLLGADFNIMRYIAGGSRPREIVDTATMWCESGLSVDEIDLVIRSGGYDPDPFVPLAKARLLEEALHNDDGSVRVVQGERAGAWISDQLNSVPSSEVIEQTKAMIANSRCDAAFDVAALQARASW